MPPVYGKPLPAAFGKGPAARPVISAGNQYGKPLPAGFGVPPAPAQPVSPAQPPSPLDAQYQLNVGAETGRVNNQIAGLNQSGAYATTDLQTALAKLSQQRPVDERNLMNRENAQGLLYSGNYGQQEGLLGQSYADRQAGLQQSYDRGQSSRASQIAGLNDGLSTYLGQQRLDAVGRASLAAQNNPTLGAPPAPAAAQAATPAGTPPVPGLAQKLAGRGRQTIRAPQRFGKSFGGTF